MVIKALLALALSAGAVFPAYAQERAEIFYDSFAGGLNDSADATSIPLEDSPALQNVVIDDPVGTLQPRNGFTLCGSMPSGNTVRTLFDFSKSDGSRRLIVSDNASYYSTPDCVTWTTMVTGLSTTSIATYAIVRNKLWVVNGSTHAWTWDGTTRAILDGRANTPNPTPPVCKYIQYWKERVFCGDTSSNPSGIAFSDLRDSAGNDLDPSTGTTAWPATNVIQISQEDGYRLYGIRPYRGFMYAFKPHGIWRIDFQNEFTLSVEKTQSNVGTRFNDSIVEIEGKLYFVGPDGVYAFDGERSVRISDKWAGKFSSLVQPEGSEQFKAWSLDSDFDDGTFIAISSDQINGSIEIEDIFFDDFADGDYTGGTVWTTGGANPNNFLVTGNEIQWRSANCSGTCSKNSTMYSPLKVPGTFYASVRIDSADLGSGSEAAFYFHFLATGTSFGSAGTQGYYVLADIYNQEFGLYKNIGGGSGTAVRLSSASAFNSSSISDTTISVMREQDGTIRISTNGFTTYQEATDLVYTTSTYVMAHWQADTSVGLDYATIDFDDFEFHLATGSWISDIFCAVSLSSWTTFDVTRSLNGGSLSFQYRADGDSASVATNTWTSITPGTQLNQTVDNDCVQFQSSFTARTDMLLSPRIDDLTINYSQGLFTNQPISGMAWKNRYLISAASGSATANNVVMSKSKLSDFAWVPYTMEIGPMTRFGNEFYAGCSTCSAVYIMDSGQNDNGKAFTWSWESRDEIFGRAFNKKRLMELFSQFRKDSAANVGVCYRKDEQTTFTCKTVDMSGTGYSTKRNFTSSTPFGRAFRFRVQNSTIDETAKIEGIGASGFHSGFRE